jgi:hypothetical protein
MIEEQNRSSLTRTSAYHGNVTRGHSHFSWDRAIDFFCVLFFSNGIIDCRLSCDDHDKLRVWTDHRELVAASDRRRADSRDSPFTVDGDWPPRHHGRSLRLCGEEKRGWTAQSIGSLMVWAKQGLCYWACDWKMVGPFQRVQFYIRKFYCTPVGQRC